MNNNKNMDELRAFGYTKVGKLTIRASVTTDKRIFFYIDGMTLSSYDSEALIQFAKNEELRKTVDKGAEIVADIATGVVAVGAFSIKKATGLIAFVLKKTGNVFEAVSHVIK
jgi:hypothetical protein